MDSTATHLWTLEKQRWLDGADYYERRLAANAVMILPYPAGLQDRAAALQGLCPGRRWQAVEFWEQKLQRQGNAMLLSYRAVAWREACGTPVRTLCATTYVEDGASWVAVSHRQQPIEEPAVKGSNTDRPLAATLRSA